VAAIRLDVDAMDFMLYAMALTLRSYFSFNDATAGMLGWSRSSCRASAGDVHLRGQSLWPRAGAHGQSPSSHRLTRRREPQSVPRCLLARRARIGMGGKWASGTVLVRTSLPHTEQGDRHHAVRVGARLRHGGLMAALIWGCPARQRGWRWLFLVGAAFFTYGSAATCTSRRRGRPPPPS
jgi:hypothetical protein